MHWFDELYPKVREHLAGKTRAVISAGLSVSGLQHVGRLRGEISLSHFLATALRGGGVAVDQKVVCYTQDQWKASDHQVAQFKDGGGARYAGWRLEDVPDPCGTHRNWVDHYWEDFGGNLDEFAPGIHVISTTEVYRLPAMKAVVREVAEKKDAVRAIVNKYRERKPYPEGWIPFEPHCSSCRRIGAAKALGFDGDLVEYACACGSSGKSSIEMGKLNWRLEWPALWKVLAVDVEPFGKDHATPGGSRDSCKEIARAILGIEPPFGIPYEWVGYVKDGVEGDMGSSDFEGFGPGTWLQVGTPEVLRFLFAYAPLARRVVLDLLKVDTYFDQYDAAEAHHYAGPRDDDAAHQARAWEIAQTRATPAEPPFALRYRQAAYLAQIAPRGEGQAAWVERRLRATGILERDLTAGERDSLEERLRLARTWVERHAAEHRVTLLGTLAPAILERLEPSDRVALASLRQALETAPWREDDLKAAMVGLTRSGTAGVPTARLFRALYLVLLGTEAGPRAAPFLAVLGREWVLDRLREAAA